jgi:hypothetical protein
MTTIAMAAPVQHTSSPRGLLTKEEFVRVTETNLNEIRCSMDELRDKSRDALLPEKELENAFNCLYDAKDLLDFYAKQLSATEEADAFLANEWKWVRSYMSDLVEIGVGMNAEIRRVTNYTLKSRNGTPVGQGDEIEVRHVPSTRTHRGIIYRNWIEVDRTFWLKDHNAELSEYERGETPRYRDYDDDYGYHY